MPNYHCRPDSKLTNEHKSETPKCLHCDKTLDVKAPPTETVCENCGAHGVIKKSETPETDAVVKKSCDENGGEFLTEDLLLHARQLEKQRDQARRDLEDAKRELSLMRTQCRVGDVAFQHLHCTSHGQPIPDWVKEKLPNLYLLLSTNDQLRVRVLELEKALFSCSSELTDIKDMHRGDLIRARIAEKRVAELEKAIRNHVEASNSDDSAGYSFGVLVEIIKAIDEARKGQE